MGNCCDGTNNDYDIINIQLDKERRSINNQSTGKKNKNSQKIGTQDYNNIPYKDSPSKLYLSKKKLKLIIKQSKSLIEGEEYIINSLGLTNSKNNYKDGLTVFGDTNVSINKNNNILKKLQSNNRTDFVFPEEESNTGQNHAEIYYDRTLDLYQIRSIRGNGCFLKIDKKIVRKTF